MTRQGCKRRQAAGIIAILIFLATFPLTALIKKVQIVSPSADIRLNSDDNSPLLETLLKGTILSLNSSIIVKKSWYAVSYKSETSKNMKSGYVHVSDVELLFQNQKIINISGEEKPSKNIEPILQFKNQPLGLKSSEIISLEGQPSRTDRVLNMDILGYDKNILGQDCVVEYVFYAGRLVGTRLNFSKLYQDKNQSLSIYKDLKSWLSEAYGHPEDDQEDWRDTALKPDIMSWGHAVSQGHLRYNSIWTTSKADIKLNLSGENSEIVLELNCTEKGFNNLAKKDL